jgi:hypothetical protein
MKGARLARAHHQRSQGNSRDSGLVQWPLCRAMHNGQLRPSTVAAEIASERSFARAHRRDRDEGICISAPQSRHSRTRLPPGPRAARRSASAPSIVCEKRTPLRSRPDDRRTSTSGGNRGSLRSERTSSPGPDPVRGVRIADCSGVSRYRPVTAGTCLIPGRFAGKSRGTRPGSLRKTPRWPCPRPSRRHAPGPRYWSSPTIASAADPSIRT